MDQFPPIPPDSGLTAHHAAAPKAEPVKVKAAFAGPTSQAPLPGAGTEKNPWQQSSEVKKIIEGLEGQNSEISIVLHAQHIIVKVLDSKTGEVIRRVPLKDPLPLSQGPKELTGLVLDTTE